MATSVNPIDFLLRAGHVESALPLELPATPGRDAVGIVDEIGPGVDGTRVGDLVFGLGGVSDTTAQYAVLTAWSSAPSRWSIAQAAAAGLASATAAGVTNALGVLDGRVLLIEGASGAVGSAVAGARVIGTARIENHAFLTEMGVQATKYGPGLANRVRLLAPDGLDAAVHAAPSRSLPDLVDIVGDPARVITVIDGETAARLGARKVDAKNDSALLEQAADLGRRGLYTPRVDHVLPLAAVSQAHSIAESGSGKVVISAP
jgi:NADPH:quinone reductase-like Zn-dependent oxidoreductase